MCITGDKPLPDILFILIGLLAATTFGAAILYYRQLRRAQKEYEKARGTVEDVVLSFNRQLKHEAQRLEIIAYKVEALTSRSEGALGKAEETARKMTTLETKVVACSEDMGSVAGRLDGVDKKVCDVIASHELTATRITSLEEQAKRLLAAPESSLETAIPIKRDKAMAQLTGTELSVLQMLTAEGAKTAPEIKERVKLSREHTARLMKKLYEQGYLERETSKIPFKYSVKKEMEKLLKRTEEQAT
jgi:DNA-binding MarR family transcriptional regulator